MILPQPDDPGLTIDAGWLTLSLPLIGAHERIAVPEPANPNPLPTYIEHAPGRTSRRVERDLTTGLTHYRILEDTGLFEHPGTGLSTREVREETWSIDPADPLSLTGTSTWTCEASRPGWQVKTVATARLACTATDWLTSADVTAFEGEMQVFEKHFEKVIARDFM